jgi:hypothetical protein
MLTHTPLPLPYLQEKDKFCADAALTPVTRRIQLSFVAQ